MTELIKAEAEFASTADYLTYLKEMEDRFSKLAESFRDLRTVCMNRLVDDGENRTWSMFNSEGREVSVTRSADEHPVDMAKVFRDFTVFDIGDWAKSREKKKDGTEVYGLQMTNGQFESFHRFIKARESRRVNKGKLHEDLADGDAKEHSGIILEEYLDLGRVSRKGSARLNIKKSKNRSETAS